MMNGVSNKLSKLWMLTMLAFTRPREFSARVQTLLDRARDRRRPRAGDYPVTTWEEFVDKWQRWTELSSFENELAPFAREISDSVQPYMDISPIDPKHNGDPVLAQLAYFAVRTVRPEVVVESGVAHGVTSSFVLKALDDNRKGKLVSIDLPPLGSHSDDWVGIAIPDRLRARWELVRGRSAVVLPSLTKTLPPIGVFVHDSLFTYRNTRRELGAILSSRAEAFAVLANCVEKSNAFREMTLEHVPDFVAVLSAQTKDELIGLAIYGPLRN